MKRKGGEKMEGRDGGETDGWEGTGYRKEKVVKEIERE